MHPVDLLNILLECLMWFPIFLDFQGFSTGVALYHLGRMRVSLEYATEVNVTRMRQLSHKKYLMPGTVGDQVRT